MTPSEFAANVRFRTHSNSTTFANADLLRIMNKWKNSICKKAIKSTNEDLFVVPADSSLVADQREYSLPDDLVSLRRVECSFDGDDWVKLLPLELSNIQKPTTEAQITELFTNIEGEAYYDVMRKSVVIYSGTIIAVTDGLKIWYEIYPADITDLAEAGIDMATNPSTTSFGIPEELQAILEDAVVIEYKNSKDRPLPLTDSEQLFKISLKEAIEDLKNSNRDRSVMSTVPQSSEAVDNGFGL